jgi:5-methylcytosine-specific restriction enzyme A
MTRGEGPSKSATADYRARSQKQSKTEVMPDREGKSGRARLYDLRRWRDACAPLVLAEEPLCRYCAAQGRVEPAVVVDHIVSVQVDPDRAFERSNLQPLCKSHHDSAKRQQDQHGYHRMLDANGYPLDPEHPANRTTRGHESPESQGSASPPGGRGEGIGRQGRGGGDGAPARRHP